METPACIRLPYMRPGRGGVPCWALSLWPGHNETIPAGAWQPDNYPLNPASASSFLKSLELLSCSELEAMHNSLSAKRHSDLIKEREEMSALCEFAGRSGLGDVGSIALELAQQLLLWSWHQETALDELAELEQECLLKEQAIPRQFLESCAEERVPLPVLTSGPTLPWRSLAANAAFFIAPEQAILAEGGMATDLAENLDFKPCDRIANNTASEGLLLEARAPLWQALGYSGPARKEAAPIYNSERAWLIWRDE